MLTSAFSYDLPPELIAQTPLSRRDGSRLLTLTKDGAMADGHFYELPDLLNRGDCLILNDSRVLPARLYGIADSGATLEVLLLTLLKGNTWDTLVKPGRKAPVGRTLDFGEGLRGTVVEVTDDGNRYIHFDCDGDFFQVIEKIGHMPLPPYIKTELKDNERYQTVYAKDNGSAAAPTAGLHFTSELLQKLRDKGINIGFVTLHVGLGTFRPVKVKDITGHHMHTEHYWLPQGTADLINKTKKNGGRVIAVGTTACRTLETVGLPAKEADGWTGIFIYPPYTFQVIDGLITNFHLPESTLLMLVSAFSGRETVLNAYRHAVEEKYRFFSFGDAMLLT
ncbi:MAG: tRNA preQ1(34) S-adenosylmethionine ribosyltransferase-isomerase QueA [Oscillospiraceae bacterium]|nr:tRNA preQ1(34) S-adenosylmethionine ribosyltransferase-isomerase QueA [Oscillospiraceae bacterium]